MKGVNVSLCLLLCAAAVLSSAVAASPLLHAFMGSLDYGGRPPHYEQRRQVAQTSTSTAKPHPKAQPLNHGYMGSLDYGGQPPSYESPQLSTVPASWPVDRRSGAPRPLEITVNVVQRGDGGGGGPGKQAQTPQQGQSQPEPQSSGFGIFGKLLKMASGATQAVGNAVGHVGHRLGDAVGNAEARIGSAVKKQAKQAGKVSSWLFG